MENELDLRELIDSWENMAIIVRFIGDHPEQLETLVGHTLNDNLPNSWRAAWLMDKIHEKHPDLIIPFLPSLTQFVMSTRNEGKRRHLLKIISLEEIPDEQIGVLLDFSIGVFTDAKVPVAVRVHAMQTLYNIAQKEPDFSNELIQLIENEIEYHGSAGIASRGRKLLQKLRKLNSAFE